MEIRPAGPDDAAAIRWALFTALDWSPDRQLPPVELVLTHPEAVRYHRDWGRRGDLGILATQREELVGVAFCRLFTESDHGHGYVDDETPEVAVAVRGGQRGRGVGEALLRALAELVREHGFARLSLSVDSRNPARRLYERLGYEQIGEDEDGVRMVIDLAPSALSRD